jgi:hypothetical protein
MPISTDTTDRFVESYLAALDCPRSLAVWLMFSHREHDQLAALDIDPENYLDLGHFRDSYLATKFLSKSVFLKTTVDKKKVAFDSFFASERSCRLINTDGFRTAHLKDERFEWIHNDSIRQIDFCLSDFSADEFFDSANWGPGVTQIIKRDTSSTNKFRLENGITRALHDFIAPFLGEAYPLWDLSKVRYQDGNKIVTVPKNSKTDRTIAIEPGLNLWFQKSIGTMIRRRLLRLGCDLNSQERNQRLSRVGSKTNRLATVDFSSASDSISISTVENLLPLRWFTVMNLVRSRFGSLEGRQFFYEKFSSMGNGFTFELESLIFLSLARSCCKYLRVDEKKVSVYGDDVIIPIEAFDLFVKICKIYGFTVNPQKSYSSGDFRESCGSHFFNGQDCKPYFLKEVVEGELRVYLAANSVSRLASSGMIYGRDGRFLEAHRFLRSKVGNPCLISEGYGDGGFIVDFDEATPPRANHGIEGFRVKLVLAVPIRYISADHALLLARLKGRSVEADQGNLTSLRSRVKYLRKKILIRQWAFLGPWII